ncbi:MAG: DUF6145 family protein [Lachnospiraceae bacterium]|nr:DUF6145 family protein [Lachnospiraceae bacterium]
MDNEEIVLCASSSYKQQYYFNEDNFGGLPDSVKDEIKALVVTFTKDIGGIFSILFNVDGELVLRPEKYEDDILYDEIGCGLKTNQLENENRELWDQLEAYYKAFVMREI